MKQVKVVLGYCKECLHALQEEDKIDNRQIFECPDCHYPNAKSDMVTPPKQFKVIGKFVPIDGPVYEDLGNLVEDYKLIGSDSADIGNLEVYYTADGEDVVVAVGSEFYYGETKNIVDKDRK